jgi:hypothetical protein
MTNESKRDPRALNAYRHGLTGQIVIQTPADQVAYDAHCKGIHDSLAPLNALETDLVQSVADDRWRLKRAAAIENTLLSIRTTQDDVQDALAQARAWETDGKHVALLSLYESRLQRRVEKNLQLLSQSQEARRAALQQAVEEAALLMQLAKSKGEPHTIDYAMPLELPPSQFVFSTAEITRLATHKLRLQRGTKPLRRAA